MQASLPLERVPARPSTRQIWMRAVRLFSFTASVTPVLIGSAIAIVDRSFDPLLFPLILLACVLCHAGCNLANDYFDFRKGTDDRTTIGRGGVIQAGWLTPGQVRTGMILAFAMATVLGLIILALSTWWLLVLAIPSLIAAIAYTGGPKPLGYIALGEVVVWLFMGMGIVCGTYIAMTGRLTWEVAFASLGPSALVAAILHANNMRDFETDRAAGKRTVAHLLGWNGAVSEFTTLIVLAFTFALILVAKYPSNWPIGIVLATLPMALAAVRLVQIEGEVTSLNQSVRQTAQLHFRFGLLLTLGLVIRAVIERIG